MQTYYNTLASFLASKLTGEEVFLSTFSGEDSDFIRFNQNAVRQAGRVEQRDFSLDLIRDKKHASGYTTLSGDRFEDERRLVALLKDLREKLPHLPDDPHLLYNTDLNSTEQHGENRLIPVEDMVDRIISAGQDRDLVGLLASGGIYNGFANSLGQRNWFTSYSFNFDWSLYHKADKAVKSGYAGFVWDNDAFAVKMDNASNQLAVLVHEPKTIPPGEYRVYLAPVALEDFAGMLARGGFSLKAQKTKQTPLIKMFEAGIRLSPQITIRENTKDGVSPNFQGQGFLKPDSVTLIQDGQLADALVSPRSAKEFDIPANGASAWEMPESLDISAGDIPQDEAARRLEEGVFINNLWYLNYSDRPGCRITGMTRFACFWVEKGKISAPLNVMRFDETAYRALGENLIGLTAEREMLLDPDTYHCRATSLSRVPGALIDRFNFNL